MFPREIDLMIMINLQYCYSFLLFSSVCKNRYGMNQCFDDISCLVIGAYSKGDFMVHLAGFDNKREWAAKILQELKAEQ